MKILLLNANRAGIGTYHRALHFGRELARRDHRVTMMTVSNEQRFRASARDDVPNFRIIECPNWGDELLPWHASGPIDIFLRLRELWSGGYDLVYAFEYQPNVSVPVLLLRRLRRFALISDWCDWHAGASYYFGGKRWAHAIDRRFEEFIRHRADYVTTINRTLHDRARSIGIAADRLAIVGEGVDPTYIFPSDRDEAQRRLRIPAGPLVVTIRDADRSTEILCGALAASRHAGLRLLVVGAGPKATRSIADKHGVGDRVLTPGRVTDEDLPHYLAAADILALPLEDNLVNRGRWPHKLGDMLAAQRPVVVSRGGEFPELCEQQGAAIVANFDVMAFARAFDDILANPAAYERIAQSGRRLIETALNWDVIGAQLADVVERAAILSA